MMGRIAALLLRRRVKRELREARQAVERNERVLQRRVDKRLSFHAEAWAEALRLADEDIERHAVTDD